MTNIEKGKKLRQIRDRLEWDQAAMAEALGLDKTYLSQLENGRRPVDDFYVNRAAEIEKSKGVKVSELREGGKEEYLTERDVRERCHGYLDRLLDSCRGNVHRLSWTLIEMERHFPLSSGEPSAAQALAKRASGEKGSD